MRVNGSKARSHRHQLSSVMSWQTRGSLALVSGKQMEMTRDADEITYGRREFHANWKCIFYDRHSQNLIGIVMFKTSKSNIEYLIGCYIQEKFLTKLNLYFINIQIFSYRMKICLKWNPEVSLFILLVCDKQIWLK